MPIMVPEVISLPGHILDRTKARWISVNKDEGHLHAFIKIHRENCKSKARNYINNKK